MSLSIVLGIPITLNPASDKSEAVVFVPFPPRQTNASILFFLKVSLIASTGKSPVFGSGTGFLNGFTLEVQRIVPPMEIIESKSRLSILKVSLLIKPR